MSSTDQTPTVAQNAFAAISIEGLLYRNVEGTTVELPATLRRMSPPLDLVDVYPHPKITPLMYRRTLDCCLPDGAPPRRPSSLPPPGHSQLSFSLGSVLGSGRSGIVHEVCNASIDALGDGVSTDPPGYLPPLVVKVAYRNRCLSLVREAWFYEEMEFLQGASIARCYGCFELDLKRGWRLHPWRYRAGKVPDGREYDSIPDYDEYPPATARRVGIAPHPMLPELIMERDRVFVLVLERLGEELSPRVYSEAEKQDIRNIYKDVASLGISLVSDVRPSNILAAPPRPPGLSSLPSPLTNKAHAFRLIGFELAQKTPWTARIITGDQQEWVNNMFNCLPYYLPREVDRDPASTSVNF